MSDDAGGEGGTADKSLPSQDAAGQSLPSLDQIRGDIGKVRENPRRVERLWNKRFGAVAIKAEARYEHLRGLRDHYTHKRMWSYVLMGMMGVLLLFQCLLLGLVGGGVWSFTDYDWLLPALMVQNLAAIIGLAYVVVKSLFRDNGLLDAPEEVREDELATE
jgi:hypothetical protein